jgi:pimeloyl-ACP methyl ester carboxylesterase
MRLKSFVWALCLSFLSLGAAAQAKWGVVLMHGKTGGGALDSSLTRINSQLEAKGMLVLRPQMPWSRDRYLEGDWELAMQEIKGHVQTLRTQGATKVVLAGHSLGSPAALSYAARFADVDGVVMMAPGHVPHYYYECIPYSPIRMCAVKDSVDEARKLVADAKGEERNRFNDINQGRRISLITTARAYLSYFDPSSDAEMAVSAVRLPAHIPVLWIIGTDDRLVQEGRQYVFDKLPPNPKSQYLVMQGNHFNLPAVGASKILDWIEQLQ